MCIAEHADKFAMALDKYLELEEQIYEYFKYTEDWVTIPLSDCREYFWKIIGGEGRGGEVRYDEEEFSEEGTYAAVIYTQRFLKKWVYRGADYTMICADTQVDGNKYLMIFDNKKEMKDE